MNFANYKYCRYQEAKYDKMWISGTCGRAVSWAGNRRMARG